MDNRTFIEFSSLASYPCYCYNLCLDKYERSSNHSQTVTQPIFQHIACLLLPFTFLTHYTITYLHNSTILANKHSKETTTIQSDSHPELNSRTKRQTGNPAEHKRSCNPSFSPESCSESPWPASD